MKLLKKKLQNISTTVLSIVVFLLSLSTSLSAQSLPLDGLPLDRLPLDSSIALDTSLVVESQLPNLIPDSTTLDSIAKLPVSSSNQSTPPITDTDSLERIYQYAFYLKSQIRFINLSQRTLFQSELSEAETTALEQQTNDESRAKINAQDYQQVNLAFPILMGFKYRPTKVWALGIGMGYLYHQQETLMQLGSQNQEWSYAVESFPIFLEVSHLISSNIIQVTDVNQFHIGARIFAHYGNNSLLSRGKVAISEKEFGYDGWGAFLGYEYFSWKYVSINTEVEYSQMTIQSKLPWAELLPKSQLENEALTQWDMGGIAISFTLEWNFGKLH